MKVQFSRLFEKDARSLPEKMKVPLLLIVGKVMEAASVREIKNCKKLSGYDSLYRIRMGMYRIVFLLLIIDDVVFFQRVLPRGEVYKKHNLPQ